MKKIWKIILWVGGFIGAILLFTFRKRKPKTKVYFEDKIEEEKKEVKDNIQKTSNKISETKSHVIDTKSAESTVSDFEDKYRKK